MTGDGHFMVDEIREKITALTQRRKLLLETSQRREEIYLQNLDALLF